MPTINQLSPAAASTDSDSLVVSQGNTVRRITRAQLLAGLQPALGIASGALLGRSSAGVGSPEPIVVGANLTLRSGVLSAAAPYSVPSLSAAGPIGAADLVALGQGGRDVSVPVGTLLAGISGVPGLDLSGQSVRAIVGAPRTLRDWAGDAVAVEAFGAVGDGVTDDSAAINQAASSGRPVRFGAKTYVLNGQWTVLVAALLIGVPGETVLRRTSQAGGAWISAMGASFSAFDIVFDAGSLPGDSWGVQVASGCSMSWFERCWFRNATGASLGSGLAILARDGLSGSPSRHMVRACTFTGNAVHGVWVQAASGVQVIDCLAHGNGQYGICLDFNDPAFQQTVRHGQVSGCEAWGNRRGISVGNYNETNLEPPRWGNANPDAIGATVSGNRCHDNSDYGIAVSGRAMQVVGNLVESNGSGILVNASLSQVSGNLAVGPGQFGIDAGGSVDCEFVGNQIQGFAVGINPGGSQNVRVAGNGLLKNTWGITAFGMETDGQGVPFGIACTGLTLEGNRIELIDGTGGGVLLADAPQGVAVVGNDFVGGATSSPSQALWAHTDQLIVCGNRWNNQARVISNPVGVAGVPQVQFPDVLDEFMLTSAPAGVGSMVGQHQAAMAGQVTFIKMVSGGVGYTRASVAISGAGGGATALAYVRDGAVIAVAIEGHGSGYETGSVAVAIIGDGSGALAVATVGLPVPEGRRLRVQCNGAVRFKRVGSVPFQDNWTGVDFLVPPASVVEWLGTWGGWQAVAFPLADYVAPAGDGSLVVRSVAGDIALRPAGAGTVRVSSDGELVGFASLLGRGSPEGLRAAPVGSDYRNLNGGIGATLWLKVSGSGPTGWSAIG